MMAGIPSGNADTVDSFHASQTALPNTIPVTSATGKLQQATIPGLAFKAKRNAALNSSSGGGIDIVFDQEHYDYGSWYDPATGLATAPINGIYHLSSSAFTETNTTTRNFFMLRGTAASGTNPNGTTRGNERSYDFDSGWVRRARGEWEIYMAAGDTIGVNLYTNGVNALGNGDTWFAGHLVMAL